MHPWLSAIRHQYVAQYCPSGINMAVQHALIWLNAVHHASKWLSTVHHRTMHHGSMPAVHTLLCMCIRRQYGSMLCIRHQYIHCCAPGINVGSGVEFGPPLHLASNQSARINNHTIYSVCQISKVAACSSNKRWGDLDCTRWPF